MIMTLQLIAGLGFLVFVHELGHFLFARLFGMRVEKFVIFIDAFNFKLLKFKKGETEYSIGWIPIGGYVKISGMVDESMETEQLAAEPQPWEFRSFAAWKRIVVLLGGILANLIVAILIYWGITFFVKKDFIPIENVTDGIYAFDEGKSLGFRNGDIIKKVNGKEVNRFEDAYGNNYFEKNIITIFRGGKTLELSTPPVSKNKNNLLYSNLNFESKVDSLVINSPAEKAGVKVGDRIKQIENYKVNVFGDIKNILRKKTIQDKDTINMVIERNLENINIRVALGENKVLGAYFFHNYEKKNYTFLSSLKYGNKMGMDILKLNLNGFRAIFTGDIKFSESVAGPIGIAKIYGSEFKALKFWQITALISLILAITNLIPIPVLDGGHILIILIEELIGKDISENLKMKIQMVGFILLLGLMVFTIINDIIRF